MGVFVYSCLSRSEDLTTLSYLELVKVCHRYYTSNTIVLVARLHLQRRLERVTSAQSQQSVAQCGPCKGQVTGMACKVFLKQVDKFHFGWCYAWIKVERRLEHHHMLKPGRSETGTINRNVLKARRRRA
ncbi:unnamed protein product [Calypogeia fissa]